ncbi:g11896 [Coccomyxa elongata]
MQADLSRTEKVASIFAAFDSDGDGLLCKEELSNFIEGVNPYVGFTEAQLSIILEEVAVEYAAFHAKGGLTFEGLQQTYEDGIGDVDIDYETLGLDVPVALGDSAEKPTELFYDAVASAPTGASAAGVVAQDVPADAEGTRSQTVAELEGTPLKKALSAGAGSAVFTMVARAGAVAGPPSRQTSGQFAAEHGLPTPPGSARSVRSAQSFATAGPLSRESSGTFLQGAGMEGLTPTMPRIALRPAKLRAEAAAADVAIEGTPQSARSIRSSSSPWSASRPGSGQPGSAGWGSRGALKAFPSRPGSAEDISRPQETAPQEETSDQGAPQQTRMSAQIEALVSASDAGSSMIRQAGPHQAEAAAVTRHALPAAGGPGGAAQLGASLKFAHDAPGAHVSHAKADAVAAPVAAEHAPEGGTEAPRETAPAAAADAVLSRKRPRAIDSEHHSSPAPHVAAAPALLDACMQGKELFGNDPDGNVMSSQRPRGRSASNESFFSTAEEAEGNMEVEASASSYANSAAYSPASSAVDGSETPGAAEPAEHCTAVNAVAFGPEADTCMLPDKPDAAAIESDAALEAGSTSTRTTAAAEEQVSAAEEEKSSTLQHVASAAATEGDLRECSPARASSGGRLGAPSESAAGLQLGEFAAAEAEESPAARALTAAGEIAPRMANAADAAATAPATLRSVESVGDQAFVEASGASPGLGKRRRVDQQVRMTASTGAITTASETAEAFAASQPSPVAATDTRAHVHGKESATAARNKAEADRTAAVMGDCSGAAAVETANSSADAMAGAGDRECSPSPVVSAALAAGVTVRHKRGSRTRSGAAAKAAKTGAAAEANASGAAAGHEAEAGMAAREVEESADVKAGGTAAPTEAAKAGAAAAEEALTGASADSSTSGAACGGVTDVSAASEAGGSAAAAAGPAESGAAAEAFRSGVATGKAAGRAAPGELGSTGAAAGISWSGTAAAEPAGDVSQQQEPAEAEAPPKSPARAAFMPAFGALARLARGTPSRGAPAAAAAEPAAAHALIPEASDPVAKFCEESSSPLPTEDSDMQAAGLSSTMDALAEPVATASSGSGLGAAGPAELSRSAEKRAASLAAADAASYHQMLEHGLRAMPPAMEAASHAAHAAAGTATPSSGAMAVSQVIAGGQTPPSPQHAAMNKETVSPAEGAVQTEDVLLPAQHAAPIKDTALPAKGAMLRMDASAPGQRGCAPAQHAAAKQDIMLSTKGAAAEEHELMPVQHAAPMHDTTSPAAGAHLASLVDRSGLAPAQPHAPAEDIMLLSFDGAAADECALAPAQHAAPIQDTASPPAGVYAGVDASAPGRSSLVPAQHGNSEEGALENQGRLPATQSAMQSQKSQDDAPVGEGAQSQAPSHGSTAAAALTKDTVITVPQLKAEEKAASTMAAPASVHSEAVQQKHATLTAPPHMDAAGRALTLAAENRSSSVQGEAAAAQGAEGGPAHAETNTVAAVGQQSGLLSSSFGPGDIGATSIAAASMAAADDRTDVLRMDVTPGTHSAGSHKQLPATGNSVMGPPTATTPVTAAQAELQAEKPEQQGSGTAQEIPSVQAQPRSPARAVFLSAWGALARLAGGTPPQTTPAAADTGAAPAAASAEADAAITAALSCSDKDPADSAAQPMPVAGNRGASRAAGHSPADATLVLSNGGSSGDEGSADPDALLVSQAPGCDSIGPRPEGSAMLAAGPGFGGAADTRHAGCAAVMTAAAEARSAQDSSSAVISVESEAAAKSKDVTCAATARAAIPEAQASASAGATTAATQESSSDLAADAFQPLRQRHAPVAAGKVLGIGLSQAEPQGEAAAAASNSGGSGQKAAPAEDGAASVHAEAPEQLHAGMAAPSWTDTPGDCAQEPMHAGHSKAPFTATNQKQLCEPLAATQELEASSGEGADMSREQAASAGHDAECRNEFFEAGLTQSSRAPEGENVPRAAAQAGLHLNLDEEASSKHTRTSCLLAGLLQLVRDTFGEEADGAGSPASGQGSPVSPARQAFLAAFGSVQGQPTSPARARFLSAFGELARLAQGTPSDNDSAPAADATAPVARGASAHGSGAAAGASASPAGFDGEQPSSDGPASADREGAMIKTPVCDGASATAADDAGATEVVAPTDTVSVSAAASADSAASATSHGTASSVHSAAAAKAGTPAATVGDAAAAATKTGSARTPEDSRSATENAAVVESAAPGLTSGVTDATAFAAAPSTIRSPAFAAAAASPEDASPVASKSAGLGTTADTDQAAAAAADSSAVAHLKDGNCSPEVGISSSMKAPALAVPGSVNATAAAVAAAAPEGTSVSSEALASTNLVAQSAAIPGGACISSMAASAAQAGSLAALSGEATGTLQSPLDEASAWDADAGATPVLGRVEAIRQAGIGANTPPTGNTPGAAVSPLESFPISAEDASTEVSPDASSVTQPAWLQTTPGGTVLRSFPIGDDLSPSASEATTAASPSPTPPPSRGGFHGAAAAAASTERDDVDAAAAARQLPSDGNAVGRMTDPTPAVRASQGACASAEEAEPDLDALVASRQLLGARNAVRDRPVLGALEGATAVPEAAGADFDAARELAGGIAVDCVASGAATAAQEAAVAATAEQRLLAAAAPAAVAPAAASWRVEAAVAAAAARNDALLGWRTTGSQEGDLLGPTLAAADGESAAQQALSPVDECAPALREGEPNRSKHGQSQAAKSAADGAAMWDAAQQMTQASMLSAELAAADAESSRVEAAATSQAASADLEAAVAAASAQNEALLSRRGSDAAAARPIRPGKAAAIDPSTEPLVGPTSGQPLAAAVANEPSEEPLEGPTSGALLAAAVAAAAVCKNTPVGGGRETDKLGAAAAEAAARPIHPGHAAAIDPSTEPPEGSCSGALLAAAVAAAAECNDALVGGGRETDALWAAAQPIHPGHTAATDETSRELLEGSSRLAMAVAAAAACNDALVGGGRVTDALGAAVAAAAARNTAVLGPPSCGLGSAAQPAQSPPSSHDSGSRHGQETAVPNASGLRSEGNQGEYSGSAVTSPVLLTATAPHGYLPASSPKRPLSASSSGGPLTAAEPHGYVPVAAAAAAAASAEPSFASPKKLPGDGAHSYVPISRPRTPHARPAAALPASRSLTAAQSEHLTFASELQHPGAQAGVEAAAAAAAAARRQPSLVPPREILTRASAAAQHSVESVSETEYSVLSVPVSQRSVPACEPSPKSRDAQQQGMRRGAKVVETGDAPASLGATEQGASSGYVDNFPDEPATVAVEEGAVERQMLHGINPSLLPARTGQTGAEIHQESETEQKPLRTPAFRKSLDSLQRPVSAERPRQAQTTMELGSDQPGASSAVASSRGRSPSEAIFPAVGKAEALAADFAAKNPSLIAAAMKTAQVPSLPAGQEGAMGTETTKLPPAFREALLRLRRTGSAGAPTAAASELPLPLSEDSHVVPSTAAAAEPADGDVEKTQRASRSAAVVSTAQSLADVFAAAAESTAERPAPILPAAAGHPDVGSAPAVALTPGAGVAAARLSATTGSSDAAHKHGGEPVSRAQTVFPATPRGDGPAVPGVAAQLSRDGPVAVQGHASTSAADGAAAARAARQVQAAAAAMANPALLLSTGRRMAGAVNQGTEAESEEPQRRPQPAFQTAFKRLQQPSPISSRPTSAISAAAAATGMDSTSPIAAALAPQKNAKSSIKPCAASAFADGVMTSAAVTADASAAGTAVATPVTRDAVETSSKVLVPEAAVAAAEGRLHSAQGSHSLAGLALTASACSGGVLLAPQEPQLCAMASAEEAGNGAGRMPQLAPAGADRTLTGSQPSLRGTDLNSQAAAERGDLKRGSAALAVACPPQHAAAGAPNAEELPYDHVVAAAVVRAEVRATPDQARAAGAVTEQGAGPQPKQATISAADPHAPDLARGAEIAPNLRNPNQATARPAPHQAQAAAPEEATAPEPDQDARSAGTRALDVPRTAHRLPALAGSLSNADELAWADDVVIGSVPSRHPRQKLDFGDRCAAAEEPQQPHVAPEVFGRLQALRDFYKAPVDEDDHDASTEARSAHKVAAAAKEAESVACILESVYAEVAKGDKDLAEVSPMCLWTNPLCGQEDSPLVQPELKSQPHQETPQPTSEQEELLGWFKEQMLEAQAQRRTVFSSSLAEQSAAFAKAAAERVKALEGNAKAKAAAAPRLAAAKSSRKSEDSKSSRLTSKIASMLPSPKGGKVRPGRKEANRAWINPLCDDIAGDSTASSGIQAAGGGLPGRSQLSSGGADLAREGTPDQAAFGSPGLLDSGSVLATQPSAQLLSSYSQVKTGALLSSDLMGSTGWFNPSYGIQAADASFSSAGSANAASRVSIAGAGVIGKSSAHDASSFTFPATRRSSATSAVSSLASRQPSVLARTSMAPSLDDAEAPTPEFVPAARGDIFNSALDIMATHQSVYSDDMAHTLGSDINSLVSTLPTGANPQGERSGAGDLMGTRELMTTQQMLASRFEVAPLETGPGAAGRAPAAAAAAAQLPDRPGDGSDNETETSAPSRGPPHQPVPPSEGEAEESGFDIAAEQSNAVETLAEVLSAARAVVDGARLGADISAPMSALRARMGRLPDAADVHAAHMACGSLLASRGFYEEGVISFRAALALRPRSARALFHLGNAQFALQAFAEAERSFKAALQEVRPGDERLVPKVHVNLGITLEADGRLLAACNHYQAASQLEPTHFRARKLLGSAQYALADLPTARDALTAALALRPDYADAHCDLGCTLCALNEVEAAKAEFKAALAIMPRHLEALFNLGNLQRQCGEFEAAIANYEGVLEISPDHWRGLLNYSVALVGIGRHDDAKRALRRAFKLSGYSGKVAEEIGQLKRLARRGEDRARLGELMDHISDRTAETVMQRPAAASPPQPKKLWRPSPARGKRPSSDGQQAQGSFLDVGLLRQLEPLASLTPVALAAAATDSGASNRRGEFEPAPGAKVVSAAAAEAVLRRVMPGLAALRFQHLMRIVRNDFLRELEAESGIEGGVDLGMLLALLVAVCKGDASVRLSAAHAILDWRADSAGVTRSAAMQYTRLLRRVYVRRQRSAAAPRTSPQDGSEILSEAQFVDLVLARDSGCPAFAGLHDEAASAAAEVA